MLDRWSDTRQLIAIADRMLSELTFNGGAAVAAGARDNICVSWGNRSGLYLAAIRRRDPIRRAGARLTARTSLSPLR